MRIKLSSLKRNQVFVITYCEDLILFKRVRKLCPMPDAILKVKNPNTAGAMVIGNDNFSIAINMSAADKIFVLLDDAR